jgi:serine/threonine-protein kinase
MLAGEPPFRGATAVEVAVQHVTGRAKPLAEVRPDLPPAVCDLIHRMMARNPDDRFPTARDLLREIARLREGMSAAQASRGMPAIDVTLVGTPEDGSSVVRLRSDPSLATAAPPADAARPPARRKWLVRGAFALSLVIAALVGIGLARARRPATPLAAPGGEGADPDAAPLDKEPALRLTAEIYLAAGPGKDVSVGMSLCLRLATMYLDQHRLDEADKLFTRLDNIKEVRAYHAFGRLGRAVVLALRDKAEESNKLFREIALAPFVRDGVGPKGEPRRPDPELAKVWQNPSFLFWLAQAVRYNHINGVPDGQVPPPLRRLLDVKPKA